MSVIIMVSVVWVELSIFTFLVFAEEAAQESFHRFKVDLGSIVFYSIIAPITWLALGAFKAIEWARKPRGFTEWLYKRLR